MAVADSDKVADSAVGAQVELGLAELGDDGGDIEC